MSFEEHIAAVIRAAVREAVAPLDAEIGALARLHNETARAEDAQIEIERLRSRIATLQARLARVLYVAEGTGQSMRWTDHNGGGTVWGWRRGRREPGRVWSRRHAARGGER